MTENARSRAARLDAEDRPLEAAAAYEEALAEADADLDLFLKLAGIYLVCQDFGYIAAKKLADTFVAKAWQRYDEVLDEAERRFGACDRIEFWRHYGRWRVLLDEAEVPKLRDIHLRGRVPESCLVSGEPGDKELLARIRKLYESLSDQNSIIARDLRSIAESRLQTARNRGQS